jgi:hypothetical protein
VEPPDVGAFQQRATRSGSSPSGSAASASKPIGAVGRSPWVPGSTPTTSAGSASSMIASRSTNGSRWLTGCTVAPSFNVAIAAS